MKENLHDMTRDLFAEKATAHLAQLLGRSPENLAKSVDRSIATVIDGLSSVVKAETGRQVLHEAIQNSDEATVRDPASRFQHRLYSDVFRDGNSQLAGIVGDVRRRTMIEELQNASNIPHADSEKILGYVAPGVLSVAKIRVSRGGASDTPAGVGRLFMSETATVTAVGKPAPASGVGQVGVTASQPGAIGAPAVSHVALAANDNGSGALRWWLPLLLLAGLMFLLLKSCSDQRVAGEQQSKLRSELEGVQQQSEAAQAEVVALKGQYESATADYESVSNELERAGADLQRAGVELEQANAQSTQLNEQLDSLQAELSSTRDSLQRTQASSAELEGKLREVSAELAEIRDVPTDTAELQLMLGNVSSERDAANAFYEETLRSLEARSAELSAMTDSRDQAKVRIGEYESANATLNKRLDRAIAKNLKLREQLDEAEKTGAALALRLADTTQALERQSAARVNDVNRLSAASNDLQGQLNAMLGARDEAVRQLQQSDREVAALAGQVATVRGQVAELTDAKTRSEQQTQALEEKLASVNAQLEGAQGNIDQTRATLVTTELSLADANAELDAVRAEIDTTTAERDQLLQSRDSLTAQLAALGAQKDAALQNIDTLNGQVAKLAEELDQARAADADSQQKLGALNGLFSGLQSEMGLIRGARDEATEQSAALRAQVADLQNEWLAVAEDLGAARDDHRQALAAMRGERDDINVQLARVQATLQADIATLETQRDEALARVEQANADLAALNAAGTQARSTIEQMAQDAGDLQSELEAERQSVAKLQASVESLASARDVLGVENDGSNLKIAALGEQMASLQVALQGERESVADLNATIAMLESSRDQLARQRDQSNGEIESLQGRLQQSDMKIGELNSAVEGLQSQLDEAAERQQQRLDATASMRDEIASKLANAGVEAATVDAIEDNRSVAIALASGDLYGVGSGELSKRGRELLRSVGTVVAEYPDWRLDVEGHTDAQGIGAVLREKYPTNWELSSARASAAVRFLNARIGIEAERMSARGFGQTRPLDSNDSEAGRKKNRRVELILRR